MAFVVCVFWTVFEDFLRERSSMRVEGLETALSSEDFAVNGFCRLYFDSNKNIFEAKS